jgi:hypothetical protein
MTLKSNHRSPFPPMATVRVCDGSHHITFTTDSVGALVEHVFAYRGDSKGLDAWILANRTSCGNGLECKGWFRVKRQRGAK